MNTSKLQKSIELALEKGQKPFYVNAIAGSTVLGMFDDFQAISNICKKHSIWMHVDASWGGPAILSKTHNALMKGVELADSVTWSPHKGMGIANQCSALIINNHLGALERSNSSNADYLFQKNEENEFTLGDKTLQCGRKNDALKFWLAWKWHGRKGF